MVANSIKVQSSEIEKVIVARIDPGHDLQRSIEAIAEKESVSAGLILSAVGSLRRARVRNISQFPSRLPISDGDRTYHIISGPIEILSISGNICKRTDNVTHAHLHMVASKIVDKGIVVFGGHVVEGCETYVMVEILIGTLRERSFTRNIHDERKSWEICFPG